MSGKYAVKMQEGSFQFSKIALKKTLKLLSVKKHITNTKLVLIIFSSFYILALDVLLM